MSGEAPDTDKRLTHLDDRGRVHMVDVTGKVPTVRRALARCTVVTRGELPAALAPARETPDPLDVARMAGMYAAKQTARLIPLCHPIQLTHVTLDLVVEPGRVTISAETEVVERTGVEMEALTACLVAGLNVVCALLGADPWARIDELALWRKTGGRSGTWVRPSDGSRGTARATR